MTAQAELKEKLIGFFDKARTAYEHVFLVDFIKNPKDNHYTFLVDGSKPVQLAEIAHISRLISRQIDEEIADETAFRYEVSTPGADKPLKMPKQFPKHIGRAFICTMKDETEIEGKLIEASDKEIIIETPSNKKKKVEAKTHILAFDNITEAKIKLEF